MDRETEVLLGDVILHRPLKEETAGCGSRQLADSLALSCPQSILTCLLAFWHLQLVNSSKHTTKQSSLLHEAPALFANNLLSFPVGWWPRPFLTQLIFHFKISCLN